MRNARYCLTLPLAAILGCIASAPAQYSSAPAPLLLAGSTDIGSTLKGTTVADHEQGTFRISGGGADMWGAEDAFRLGWVRLSGDATLTADVHFDAGAAPLSKGVLIFRQSLAPNSAYADVAIHGDGHVTLQYRADSAGQTKDITAPEHGATRIRIERSGDRFTASTRSSDGTWTSFASQTVALTGPVYLGLGVCSHNPHGLVTVTFTHATLKHTAHLMAVQH